jgi:hypothetical protein
MARRKHTYIAAVWQRDIASGRGNYRRLSPIHNLGSDLTHACERARNMLPVPFVEGTAYTWQRDLEHAPYAVIERREMRRLPSGRIMHIIVGRHEYVEPEVRIVPSVGELGWTP